MQISLWNANRIRPCTANLAILLLATVAGLAQADSKNILYRADSQRTGRSANIAANNPNRTWTYKIGALSSSSPVIDENGIIYYAAYDKYIYAVKGQGELEWRKRVNSISSAAISGGTVYFGSLEGRLHALDGDGNSSWPAAFNAGTTGIGGSALVDKKGCIYVGTQDNWVMAVNPDGSQKWAFKTGGAVNQALTTSPDESVIYAPSADGCIYAINSDGSLRWKREGIMPSGNCSVADDGSIYVGSESGVFYALNPDGTTAWSYQTMGKITTAPAVALDGTVYFGNQDSYLYALDNRGALKWTHRSYTSIYSAPTIDLRGTIVFGSWDGYVTALDPLNGAVEWKKSIGQRIYTSPTVGADGCVYVIDTAGNLVGVGATVNPEPSSLLALAGGMGMMFAFKRKKSSHRP